MSDPREDMDALIDYTAAVDYWKNTPATVDGVLGGFGETTCVPKTDIIGSLTFLRKLRTRWGNDEGKQKYSIEMGAGIGRVTRDLLHKVCEKVDLLEPVEPFIDQMKIEIADLIKAERVGDIYHMGMQDWVAEEGRYSLIWCQWCVGHLTDEDMIKWLDQCKKGLQSKGMLVIKENNAPVEDVFDEEDSSKTRSDESFRRIFELAGWKLIASDLQKGMPRELYPIRMYALKPMEK